MPLPDTLMIAGIPAERRRDLNGLLPWPVYSGGVDNGMAYWRLDVDRDWPALIDVTDEVREILAKRQSGKLTRPVAVSKPKKRRAGKLKAGEIKTVSPTDIRIERGEVGHAMAPVHDHAQNVIGHQKVWRVQSRIAKHFNSGEINKRQFVAGERFHRDVSDLGADVGSCLDLDRRGGGGTGPVWPAGGARGAWASKAISAALKAIGPQLGPILVWVIVDGRSPADWATSRGKPRPDGIAALRLALDALADHYGLTV